MKGRSDRISGKMSFDFPGVSILPGGLFLHIPFSHGKICYEQKQ